MMSNELENCPVCGEQLKLNEEHVCNDEFKRNTDLFVASALLPKNALFRVENCPICGKQPKEKLEYAMNGAVSRPTYSCEHVESPHYALLQWNSYAETLKGRNELKAVKAELEVYKLALRDLAFQVFTAKSEYNFHMKGLPISIDNKVEIEAYREEALKHARKQLGGWEREQNNSNNN